MSRLHIRGMIWNMAKIRNEHRSAEGITGANQSLNVARLKRIIRAAGHRPVVSHTNFAHVRSFGVTPDAPIFTGWAGPCEWNLTDTRTGEVISRGYRPLNVTRRNGVE